MNAHHQNHDADLPQCQSLIECSIIRCPQRFTRKDEMKTHVERVHLIQREHKCNSCGASFDRVRSADLK